MNGNDEKPDTLQEEWLELLTASRDEPGVVELLEIVDRANEDVSGYGAEVSEFRFVGSTSTCSN